jgi:hypothetical protein
MGQRKEAECVKKQILTCLAAVCVLALVIGARVGTAWAYFTTYAQAQGGYTIQLGDRTEIFESFSAWTKHVVITADEDSQPVFVRVKAFCGSAYNLIYSDEGGLWTPGADGYYYYGEPLNGGQSTQELQIYINDVPDEITDPTAFNVVVIYETTPVRYDQAGTAYADWAVTLDAGVEEGGST